MAVQEQPKPPALAVPDANVHESTPLLPSREANVTRRWPKSVVYRVLLTAFFVSLSFGVTQVPLVRTTSSA
jgi:hypothetical protein